MAPAMDLPAKLVPHRQGPTRAVYSKDGQFLYTTGSDCVVRRFKLGSSDEPLTLEPYHEDNVTGLICSNEKIVTCSEDASVSIFDIEAGESEKLCRSTLPVRDIAFSPDGQWVAVASDETKVKIVNVIDMTRVMELTATLARSIKHVTFHPSGNMISTVDTNGVIRVYSLSTEEPSILETISNVVPMVHSPESDVSAKVSWHPDGGSFAAPLATREIGVYDRMDWKRQTIFKSDQGHAGQITDLAWSPNGAFLASCALDNSIIIWTTSTQRIARKIDLSLYAQRLAWHPQRNMLSWTTKEGEVYTQMDVVPGDISPYAKPVHPSPIERPTNGSHPPEKLSKLRARPADLSDDEHLADDLEDAGAEWIEDDDGAGYVPNLEYRNKRPIDNDAYSDLGSPSAKRHKSGWLQAKLHEPLQPGSTPWRGQRRYLNLNLIGWIWTVEQDDHNTVTVEFHDREAHRQYHFADPSQFAFAALDDTGALFASPIKRVDGVELPATLHYRPHEAWASHSNWTISLPSGEDVQAIAISNSAVVVCSNRGYVRMYSLFGVPTRIYRNKYNPIVSAIAHGNYAMIVSNGPIRHDGAAELVYSIYHTQREETVQCDDVVSLPNSATLKSLFFDDAGHPYVYSSDGVLSVLSRWRLPGQAQWIPVLDTKMLQRRVGKDESYWPVAVMDGRFSCIILKGAERHPYFPRPITSELDFLIPITNPDHQVKSQATIEAKLVQDSILSSLADSVDDETEVTRLEASLDRNLLLLLNLACKNEQDARALDLCEMMRKTSSLDAAVKLAGYHNRINLAERIGRISTVDS